MYTPETNLSNKAWNHQIKSSFPGFMNQKHNSTNQKLLDVVAKIANLYKNDLLYITDQININEASGQILTDIANDYGVERIDNDDSFLRFMVKFQLWKSTMGAGRNDFNNILQFMLNLDANQYNVIQTGIKEYKITNVPWQFNNGNKSKLKRDMITSIIQYVAPPEYKLDFIEYTNRHISTLYRAVTGTKTIMKRTYPMPITYFKKFFNEPHNNQAGYKITNNFKHSKEGNN